MSPPLGPGRVISPFPCLLRALVIPLQIDFKRKRVLRELRGLREVGFVELQELAEDILGLDYLSFFLFVSIIRNFQKTVDL